VSIVIVVVTFPLTPVLRHGMRLACLARAARPLRLLTATSVAAHGLRATVGHRGAACVATVTVMVIATSAGALLAVEPDLTHGSYWDGVWWAIVTATTVDYGDIAPATVRGRVIATTLMLTGIGLVSTLSGSISAYFVVGEDPHQLRQIEARLGRIEALLAEVRRDRARGSAREATVPGDVGTQDPVALARGDHASQPTGEASLLRFDTEKRDLIGAGDLPVGRSG
jgi:voltage-gated potassium channel Kch